MIFIKSLMIALSTYSIIPMPNFDWNEKNMKYAICFFPVVGIICGALIYIAARLCALLNVSNFFIAAITVSIPLLVTGGIHMDGFMDTIDALSSHQPMERKLEIMKDPHTGAFAIIYCGIYLLLNMAFIYEIQCIGNIFAICPIYVLSRCISALCAVNLPNAKKSGMLSVYTKNVKIKAVNIVVISVAVVLIAVMMLIYPKICAAIITIGILWTAIYCRIVKKNFGGITGDTAGYFLQMFELFCIMGVWIGEIL